MIEVVQVPIANHFDPFHSVAEFGFTDMLIGDADGIYHPALFNDRLLLGLKGTMSEAELPVACPACACGCKRRFLHDTSSVTSLAYALTSTFLLVADPSD